MNDPNGFSYFGGRFHIFFQYAPDNGKKNWGHFSTSDFCTYEDHGIAIRPDTAYDRDGVYSGSCIVSGNDVCFFYTGNVKEEGDYDYIHGGRQQNIIRTDLKGNKKLLLSYMDYPDGFTRHIRDPKVFKESGIYYMLLGARDMDDRGCALLYSSTDLERWNHICRYDSDDPGYMWECPDIVKLDDRYYLIICKQKKEGSTVGYYELGRSLFNHGLLKEYHVLDYGHDFYATNTLVSDSGTMLIAWMGMCDFRYGFPEDAKQALTFPRYLSIRDGHIVQRPIAALKKLVTEKNTMILDKDETIGLPDACYLSLAGFERDFEFEISGLKISFKDRLEFHYAEGGLNREDRSIESSHVTNIGILHDGSSLEIFLNDGQYVFTTRTFCERKYILGRQPARLTIEKIRPFVIERGECDV